jgi:hypothetical protein
LKAQFYVAPVDYVMFFIAWLHLFCGISQAKCREEVKYILYLIKHCHNLPANVQMELKVPKDARTITKKLKLDPNLDMYVFCPKCYSLYDIESSPFECCLPSDSQISGMPNKLV